jgi:hypothetical protein
MVMELVKKITKYLGISLLIISIVLNPFTAAQFFSPDKELDKAVTTLHIILFQIIILVSGLLFYFKSYFFIKLVFGIQKRLIKILWLASKKGKGIYSKFKKIKKKIVLNKKKILKILLLFIISISCLVVLDVVARFVLPDTPLHYKHIDEITWRLPRNTTIFVIDHDNFSRNVTSTYFEHGFKRWGDVSTNKTKVLLIGDSYTQSVYVKNGEEYYAYLEEEFDDVEWFVFGHGGYGSLQEFMILDEFFDEIKPDVILWQFCSGNDFINNDFDMEKRYFPHAPPSRPYLIGDNIEHRVPSPFLNLRKSSKIIDFGFWIYQTDAKKRYAYKKRGWLKRIEPSEEEKNRMINVTIRILKLARNVNEDTPFYFFNIDPIVYYRTKEICEKVGFTCIEGVGEKLDSINQKKNIRTITHAHWNVEGNKVLGGLLIDYFKKNEVFAK